MKGNKILFITESPFSFDLNGAASFSSGHLLALFHAYPIADILILHLTKESSIRHEQLTPYLNEAGFKGAISIQSIPSNRLKFRIIKVKSILNFRFSTFRNKTITLFSNMENELISAVQKIIANFKPDLIWVEHILPALLVIHNQPEAPVIYSHHDFLFRVLKERNKFSLKNFFRIKMLKNTEIHLLKRINFFINGSEAERQYALQKNPKLQSLSFPAVYPIHIRNFQSNNNVILSNRLVHIGSFSATANRIGLAGLLKHVFPQLKKEIENFELYLIGNQISFKDTEFSWVSRDPKIKIVGHIDDLATILQPYDVHVVPYDRGTGTRTRLLNALRYHGVVVLFEKTTRDFPELKREIDLLAADNYSDFTKQIIRLLQDPDLRKKTGDRAFNKLNAHFTIQQLSEKIKQLLAA
jgi:glycosyltransferase involved in cell wall biosynthesis